MPYENYEKKQISKLLSTGLEQIEKGETIPYSADFMDAAMKHGAKKGRF